MFGHDIPVHRAITFNAQQSAHDNSPTYFAFLNIVSSDISLTAATNSMVQGSGFEDNKDVEQNGNPDVGGKRSLNHFYDPLTMLGLSDIPPDDRISPYGKNSFEWASIRNGAGIDFRGIAGLGANIGKYNIWSWQNTRDLELSSLTEGDPAIRANDLADMFRALGQVMHLLEDTSQPQHVRNEQHLDQFWEGFNTPWRSPIEDYGKTNVGILNYQHGMLDWRGAGFTKLEDFWNTHRYNGNPEALDADVSGGVNTLGLAEWCNGNFLGARHTFPEYFTKGDVEYYPFPSRDHSTDYSV